LPSIRWGVALVAASSLLALAAEAFIPRAERVVEAVAQRNLQAGRAQPLQVDLVLRIEDSPPLGTGVLVTHPTGLARLELKSQGGAVERHILQGSEHLAMRDGVRLPEPRSFLPPLFLLQTSEDQDLRAGLEQLGADLEAIRLAPCGEGDCFVVGNPSEVPPRYVPPAPEVSEELLAALTAALGETPRQDGFALSGESELQDEVTPPERIEAVVEVSEPGVLPVLGEEAGPNALAEFAGVEDEGPWATIWIDVERYEPRRIDLNDGVRIWLGPQVAFDGVEMPSWIRIDEPGRRSATFDVLSVLPVEAPAAAFSRSWLERPLGEEAPPDRVRPEPNNP